MGPRFFYGVLLGACCVSTHIAAAEERMTILFTVDAAKIGPAAACDGQFRIQGGGPLVLREWLHDGQDAVEGGRFRLSTEHDARSAAAAKSPVVRRSAFPKGLLLEVEQSGGATLSAVTRLGDFQLPLSELRKQREVAVLDGKARLQWIPNVSALTGLLARSRGSESTTRPPWWMPSSARPLLRQLRL